MAAASPKSRADLEAMSQSALVDLVLQLQQGQQEQADQADYELQLAEVLHQIDHEVEKLAVKVRNKELTHEEAADKFVLKTPYSLLEDLDKKNGRVAPNGWSTGLFKDFRVSASAGWSIARRVVWGMSRLLRMPQNNHESKKCLYVDFKTAVSTRVSSADASMPPKPANTARVVFISDTHLRHRDLTVPAGDVLVHCGDVLLQGGDPQPSASTTPQGEDSAVHKHLKDFNDWLKDCQNSPEVVLIGGNHDVEFETLGLEEVQKMIPHAKYLCHSGTPVANGQLSLWGSGYSFGHKSSNDGFQHTSDAEALGKIPVDGSVDILVTHGPPKLEKANFSPDAEPTSSKREPAEGAKTIGCKDLLNIVESVRPKIHVFGHDHTTHGAHRIDDTLFICATSVIDVALTAENPPIVVDVPISQKAEGYSK